MVTKMIGSAFVEKIVCAAVLFANFSVIAFSQEQNYENSGMGHLSIRSLSPGHLLRPNASIAVIPEEKNRGEIQLSTTIDWGNVWNYREDVFIIDGEWILVSAKCIIPANDAVQFGVIFPFSIRTGGFLDYPIEDFHKLIGLENDEREKFPRNNVLVKISGESGRKYSTTSGRIGVCDIPLFISWLLTHGSERSPAVVFQTGATIPIGDKTELEGMGNPIIGCSLLASKRVGHTPGFVYSSASISYCSTEQISGIEIREFEATAMLGFEYRAGKNTSLMAQYVYSSPVAKDFYEFSDPAHEINVGFKKRLSDGVVLEASITENLFMFNNSTDVGFHIGLSKWY